MKITKSQIEFFKSYVGTEDLRPVLKCLYLDFDTVREEKVDGDIRRYARLCATNGFSLGTIDVELDEADVASFIFPYEHLEVAKHYLKNDREWAWVTSDKDTITYQTMKASIIVECPQTMKFPDYKKISDKKQETEYTIYVGTKLLKQVVESHIKLGKEHVYIKMSGGNTPISFEAHQDGIISLLMPVSLDDENKGKLQKTEVQNG